MTTKKKLPTGVREKKTHYQVRVMFKGREEHGKMPLTSTIDELKNKRKELLGKAATPPPPGLTRPMAPDGLFAAAYRYKNLQTAEKKWRFPADRIRELEAVVEKLGDVPLASITPLQIREALADLKVNGRKNRKKGALSNGTLNRYRNVLMGLFTTLNPGGSNPAKGFPRYPTKATEHSRAFDPTLMMKVLARVCEDEPKVFKPRVKGAKRRVRVRVPTQARLLLLLKFNMPHDQIKQLKPGDIDLKRLTITIAGRYKGKSRGEPRTLPILPDQVYAAEAFIAAGAFGRFSNSSVYKSFKLGLAKFNRHLVQYGHPPIDVKACYPYTLRHTRITEMAKVIQDPLVLQRIALHATAAQTAHYSKGADEHRVEAEVARLRAAAHKRSA